MDPKLVREVAAAQTLEEATELLARTVIGQQVTAFKYEAESWIDKKQDKAKGKKSAAGVGSQ
jgi:hypothetical protein